LLGVIVVTSVTLQHLINLKYKLKSCYCYY